VHSSAAWCACHENASEESIYNRCRTNATVEASYDRARSSAVLFYELWQKTKCVCFLFWTQCTHEIIMLMVCSTKVLCPQNVFSRKSQRYKGGTSRYVDAPHLCFWHWHVLRLLLTKSQYFCSDVNKTSTAVDLLAINIICNMSQRSNVGLGIKSTAGLKAFVEEWNGHNAFAHPLKFNELLQ